MSDSKLKPCTNQDSLDKEELKKKAEAVEKNIDEAHMGGHLGNFSHFGEDVKKGSQLKPNLK